MRFIYSEILSGKYPYKNFFLLTALIATGYDSQKALHVVSLFMYLTMILMISGQKNKCKINKFYFYYSKL